MPELPDDRQTRRRWAILLPSLVMSLLASFFYFVLFPGTTFGNSFYTGIKIFLLVWPMIAVGLLLRERFIDRSRPKQHLASIVVGTAFAAAVVGLLLFLLKGTPMGNVVYGNSGQIATKIRDLGVAEHYILFAAFVAILHAALEEYYWRWFVFGQARRLMPEAIAILVAAMGFASHHVVILSQFFPLGWAFAFGACVGIGGAAWSWIYARYNSMLGPWVSHVIIDVPIVWIGWEALKASS